MTTIIVGAGVTVSGVPLANAETLDIQKGGITLLTHISAGGYELVSSGGVASNTTVSSGGEQYLNAGGSQISTTILSGGDARTQGTDISTQVSNGGSLRVLAGTAINDFISAGGTEYLFTMSVETSATVEGFLLVSSGSVGDDDTVSSGGVVSVLQNGAITSGDVVLSGGTEYVYDYGAATATNVLSGGVLVLGSGGTIAGTFLDGGAIDDKGLSYVSSGHVAFNSVTDVLTVTEAGGATFTETLSGTYTSASFTLKNDGAGGTDIVGAALFRDTVRSGQTSSYLSPGSGGVVNVSKGGVTSLTLLSGGQEYVFSGGTSISAQVSSGGQEIVSNGGSAVGTTLGAGAFEFVFSGGFASGSIVHGELIVSLGGVAASGSVGQQGTVIIGGTSATGGVVIPTGAVQTLSAVGSAITVSSGGVLDIFASGVGSNNRILSGGVEYVTSGGIASATMISSGGNSLISSGGLASATMVSAGGMLLVSSGGTTIGATILGQEILSSGGTATGSLVSSGGVISAGVSQSAPTTGVVIPTGITVPATAHIISAVIGAGGTEYVYSAAVDSGTTVLSGGVVRVFGLPTTVPAGGNVIPTGQAALVFNGLTIGDMLSSGGIEYVSSGATASLTVVSSGGLLVVNSGGTIAGSHLLPGGTIDVTSLTFSGGSFTFNSATDLLTVTEGGNSFSETLAGTYSSASFSILADGTGGTDIVACYARGTNIATPSGPVAIENLAVNDTVLTESGEPRAVVWTGLRMVDCRRHPDPASVWPVRVCADAFAPGVPLRDVLLSPDHAVFIDETLMPVRALLNGLTVRQEQVDSIAYCHLELASHDVILAEGLPAETYLDTGNRHAFENAGPSLQLHPRFGRQVHTALACAPLAESGAVVAHAHARILARAEATGFARAKGDWKVEADGVLLAAEAESYLLPAGTHCVRILSASWRPADMEAGSRDMRLLGLCLTGLSLDGVAIALHDPALCAGFHPVENDRTGQWRWTDGAATLDLGRLAHVARLTLSVARAPLVWQAVA